MSCFRLTSQSHHVRANFLEQIYRSTPLQQRRNGSLTLESNSWECVRATGLSEVIPGTLIVFHLTFCYYIRPNGTAPISPFDITVANTESTRAIFALMR